MSADIRYSRICSLCGEPDAAFLNGKAEVVYYQRHQIPHDTHCVRCGMRGMVLGEAMIVPPPRPEREEEDKNWDPAKDPHCTPRRGRPPFKKKLTA